MPRTRIATKETQVEEGFVKFSFANGLDAGIKLDDLSPEMMRMAALHGLSQKGGDAYSGEKDPTEAHAKCVETLERIRSGNWVVTRAKGEGSTTLVVEAVANLKGIEVSIIKAKWGDLSEDAQKAVKSDPKVKAEMARIKAERLAAQASSTPEDGDALDSFSL